MDLMPLATLLSDAGLGTLGQTANSSAVSIYINMMPAEAELAILLRTPLSGTRIDYELPGYYRTEFQVIVRGRSYAAASDLMARVLESLTFLVETQLDSIAIKHCRPRTEPVPFPLSKGNLLEFNVMFDIAFTKI